jgi:hypothetical protein
MRALVGLVVCAGVLASGNGVVAAESEASARPAKPATPESCQIRNKKFGELLRPEDANRADGTRIVLYPAQAWKCLTWKLQPAGESVFRLQNHFTSKTFAPATKADGARIPVIQVPLSREAAECPAWRFTTLPDGLYQITEVKSGKALTAVQSDSGVRIMVAPWEKSEEQKWELLKMDPAKLTM